MAALLCVPRGAGMSFQNSSPGSRRRIVIAKRTGALRVVRNPGEGRLCTGGRRLCVAHVRPASWQRAIRASSGAGTEPENLQRKVRIDVGMPHHKPGEGISIRGERSRGCWHHRRHSGRPLEKRRLEGTPSGAPWALHDRRYGGSTSQVGASARLLRQPRPSSTRPAGAETRVSRRKTDSAFRSSATPAGRPAPPWHG